MRDRGLCGSDGLLTVAELAAARERRALIVNQIGCVWGSVLTGGVGELEALGPDMVHVHPDELQVRPR